MPDVNGLVLPPNGVYTVQCVQAGPETSGDCEHRFAPDTAKIPRRNCAWRSIRLISEGDIYGNEMEITFIEKLRDETKIFPSLDALKEQIKSTDITVACRRFKSAMPPISKRPYQSPRQ